MTRVKICGITNVNDALAAVEAGADMIGMVFAESPRQVTIERAATLIEGLPPAVLSVGVFMDQPFGYVRDSAESLALDLVQLHGDETWKDYVRLSRTVIKRIRVEPKDTRGSLYRKARPWSAGPMFLLDPGAGSGRTFDWKIARGLESPILISGGLTPDNVREAIRSCRPYGVDVSSGVEIEAGRKDHKKMRAFISQVRKEDADGA